MHLRWFAVCVRRVVQCLQLLGGAHSGVHMVFNHRLGAQSDIVRQHQYGRLNPRLAQADGFLHPRYRQAVRAVIQTSVGCLCSAMAIGVCFDHRYQVVLRMRLAENTRVVRHTWPAHHQSGGGVGEEFG